MWRGRKKPLYGTRIDEHPTKMKMVNSKLVVGRVGGKRTYLEVVPLPKPRIYSRDKAGMEMYVEDSNILFIGTSTTIYVSRPDEACPGRDPCPRPCRWELPRAFPRAVGVAQQRWSRQPWMSYFIPSPLHV